MKRPKTKTLIGLGIGLISIASVLLDSKKEDLMKDELRDEVLEDVMKEINKE